MVDQETSEQLQDEFRNIIKWEKTQKKVFIWEKIGRVPFLILDKLTPKGIREKLGLVINEIGSFIQTGGQYLVHHNTMMKRLEKASQNNTDHNEEGSFALQDVGKLPLALLDGVADDLISRRVKFAAAQGATTGVGGVFTIAADIPLVLGLSLKVLQELALCYGFDPTDKHERIFIVKCLQFSSADVVGKKAILEELAQFDDEEREGQVFSQLKGWQEVVQTYMDSFGWKKLFQLVPVAGIVFGSISNKATIEDVSEAGKMLYKKRRILRKIEDLKQI
ncbi:EcsC family protein [Paenibacillus antarcticus]|uniref:EcsC family protein n=1 Tax=Paenibacillus antarcticus TaxID=253703 RepID=A0A168QTQ9_9BACL|nr:EcsC family protein [Paenibacillus antarcticus]OAB48194.1 hypothetical protein PBAT_00700 [Paenibacillus antarcticus]